MMRPGFCYTAFGKRRLLSVGCAVLVGRACALGAVINVPADYATIQQAIDDAADGDEVVVGPGIYYENINFTGKNLTVRSTDPLDPNTVQWTVIDGRSLNSVVIMDRGEISGFTIRNGKAFCNPDTGGGVSFWAAPGQTGEISYNVIRDCEVSGCQTAAGGGVAAVADGDPITIRGNLVTGGLAILGGGVAAVGALIEDNAMSRRGAAQAAGYLPAIPRSATT